MKKYTLALLLLLIARITTQAQCIINTSNTMPGVTAVSTSDTMIQGVAYGQSFQIYIPATYSSQAVDSAHVTVSGLPEDLTVVYVTEDNGGVTINGGKQGVICISGITYDTVGIYHVTFSGTVYTGASSAPLSSLPGLYTYTLYVRAPGPQGYVCDTAVNINLAYDDTTIIPLPAPNVGYLSGNGAVYNAGTYYPFKAVGEKLIGGIGDSVTGALVQFGYVTINAADSNKLIGVYVYDDNGPLANGALTGGPGAALDSGFISLRAIAADVRNGVFSGVGFIHGAKLSGPGFFIVVELPVTAGDTLVVFTNNLTTANGAGYLQILGWYSYTGALGLKGDSLGNFIGATICGNQPLAPGPGFDVLPANVCAGTVVEFNNVTLGSATGFMWNFGDGTATSTLFNPEHTYADTGVYLVTLTAGNAGGSVIYSSYLRVHANPVAVGTVTDATGLTAADGDVLVTVNGGIRPYTFLWSTGSSNNDSLFGVTPGIYQVTITDSVGCVITDTFTVSYSSGLPVLGADALIRVYPNPASNVLFVQSPGAVTRLEVVNMRGQTISTTVCNSNFNRADISRFVPGNYLLLIYTSSGVVKRLFTVVRE